MAGDDHHLLYDAQDPQELPPKRRRGGGGPTSRTVAELTPEQLQRKRANDREAQRNIRERQKERVQALEKRIKELESEDAHQRLEAVLRERHIVFSENESIRHKLTSVMNIVQSILQTPPGLNELAAVAEQCPPPAPARDNIASHIADSGLFPRNPTLATRAGYPQYSEAHTIESQLVPTTSPQWQRAGDAPTSHVRQWHGTGTTFGDAVPLIPVSLPLNDGSHVLDNGHRRVDEGPGLPVMPSGQVLTGKHAPEMAPHLVLPQNIPPNIPHSPTLDHILAKFMEDRRAQAVQGVPVEVLVGPLYPNFTSLVYREANFDSHPLSKLFTDIVRTFPDIGGLPEQVAVVYVMFLLMRWLINPTVENYYRIPEWFTPRPSQLFVKHPYWMDHIPWPRLRDRCVTSQPFITLDTFFVPYTRTLSVNWPHDPRDCLLLESKTKSLAASPTSIPVSGIATVVNVATNVASPPASLPGTQVSTPGTSSMSGREDEHWVLNPEFEAHLRNLGNWSLGSAFAVAFPSLADCVSFRD